jgi:aminoglycoside 6'-N-acetyltransferase
VLGLGAERAVSGVVVTLRPLEEHDGTELRRMLATPEVRPRWGPVPVGFPFGDDPEATRFGILADGRLAGLIQYAEEPDPDFRHAWIDVFVDPGRHGEGIGTAAVTTLVEHLVRERSHHRITIDPAADNAAAIRCYEKAGFRRVGVLEAAWRDPASGCWADVLLMELVRRPAC